MYLTYRYKLAPKRKQYSQLDEICEAQRQLYNAALQERRDAWVKQKVAISKIDQFKSLAKGTVSEPGIQRALQVHGRGRPPGDVNVGQWPVRRLGNTDADVTKAA